MRYAKDKRGDVCALVKEGAWYKIVHPSKVRGMQAWIRADEPWEHEGPFEYFWGHDKIEAQGMALTYYDYTGDIRLAFEFTETDSGVPLTICDEGEGTV